MVEKAVARGRLPAKAKSYRRAATDTLSNARYECGIRPLDKAGGHVPSVGQQGLVSTSIVVDATYSASLLSIVILYRKHFALYPISCADMEQ